MAGSGPRHDPCPSARPGEPGEGCGRGRPGCEQAGRAATCAAERPCRPVGRVPWGEGAALPRRPAQRGMLANGRRRSARAIVTRSAETGQAAPGGPSAPSRARPALAGSPHTEDQDCSWPINRDRPQLDVRVFAPEMLVRPRVPRVQGMTEGKPSCPITRSYRTPPARDTRGAFGSLSGRQSADCAYGRA